MLFCKDALLLVYTIVYTILFRSINSGITASFSQETCLLGSAWLQSIKDMFLMMLNCFAVSFFQD